MFDFLLFYIVAVVVGFLAGLHAGMTRASTYRHHSLWLAGLTVAGVAGTLLPSMIGAQSELIESAFIFAIVCAYTLVFALISMAAGRGVVRLARALGKAIDSP